MDLQLFETRKRDHLRHAMNPAHQAAGLSGLEQVRLEHDALPEIDFKEVTLESPCLRTSLPTPFFVSGMTAGHPDAARLNLDLALACQQQGWAMGVGSQRRELEGTADTGIDQWSMIRKKAPKLTLFANLGLSQVIGASSDSVRRVVDSLEAQALVIHANALQEALQPEGTPRFKGGIAVLGRLCETLGVPVVLKETGCGFSRMTLSKIKELGLAAVDVSGLGGTHWGRIEGARAEEGSCYSVAAHTFANWGESTADSVRWAAQLLGPQTEVWASGGVRSGLDAAKLIALGAGRVGFAQPALEAALKGPDNLIHWMKNREFELKVALFCTGCQTPEKLRTKEGAWKVSAN